MNTYVHATHTWYMYMSSILTVPSTFTLGQKSEDPLSPDGTGITFPVWKQIESVKQVCTIPCFYKHIPSTNGSGSEFMYIAQGSHLDM